MRGYFWLLVVVFVIGVVYPGRGRDCQRSADRRLCGVVSRLVIQVMRNPTFSW